MNLVSVLRSIPESIINRFAVRWVLFALAVAAVIGTAAYSYHDINRELTSVAMSRREAVAQLMAVTLSEKLGRAVDIATSLSTRVQFRQLVAQGKWQDAIKIMRTVPRDFDLIDRLFIADAKGTEKADVPALPGVRGVNFSGREWYQGVSRNWQPYVSALYKRAPVPHLNVIAIATPVKSMAEKVAGILVLQIRIENLLKWVDKIPLGKDAFVYIVDSKGQVVFDSRHPDRENIINLSSTSIGQKLRRGGQGWEIGYDAASKSESIIAHASLPDYGWGVVVQQPVHSSLGLAARDTQLRQLLTGYGIILLFGILTAIMALRISNARRKAESDARFVMIVNTATDAIISVDQDQNIVLFNHSAELIFGYSAAEMLGQPLDRLLPEQASKMHRLHVQNFAAEIDKTGRHMMQGREISGRRKDGTEFPAEASIAKSIADEQLTLTVILRDISERRKIEQALREREEYFRFLNQLAESKRGLADPVQIMAVTTRLLGEYLHVSRCVYADVEKDGEQFSILHDYTDGCASTVGQYYLSLFGERVMTTLHQGQTLIIRDVESELRSGDEANMFNAIDIKATITCPLVKDGVLRAMMAVHQTTPRDWQPREITLVQEVVERCWATIERGTAEEQIRQLNAELEQKVIGRTHELAAANKELEAFSYSVSHDLRAPLRSIDGFSQALLEDYGDGLDDQAKNYLNRVRNATQRMGLLIDDMLVLSRVTRVKMQRETADLSALAAEVRDELCRDAPGRDVDWRIQPGLIAQCDTRLLRVILVNLLGNAYKFTLKTKNAMIEFGAITGSTGAIEFFVRDNGAGFDMAYVDKLFGAFQRLHLTSDFPGTGIGLATVQRIVNRHGGHVRGEGIPDQGATFYFTLPD